MQPHSPLSQGHIHLPRIATTSGLSGAQGVLQRSPGAAVLAAQHQGSRAVGKPCNLSFGFSQAPGWNCTSPPGTCFCCGGGWEPVSEPLSAQPKELGWFPRRHLAFAPPTISSFRQAQFQAAIAGLSLRLRVGSAVKVFPPLHVVLVPLGLSAKPQGRERSCSRGPKALTQG